MTALMFRFISRIITDPIIRRLDRLEELIMALKEDLKVISDRVAEEARRDTEADSAISTVVKGLADKLAEQATAATDLAEFKAVIFASADQMRANSDKLAALALENTAADPSAPPADPSDPQAPAFRGRLSGKP